MNAKGLYQNTLKEFSFPLVDVHGGNWRFQQDNDPKHKSELVMDWLNNWVPEIIDWPPYSPDLSPIENIWAILKRRVELRKPKNQEELRQFIEEEWELIEQEICKGLVETMKERCEKVIEVGGEHIDY